jgi:hypothetical protein
MATEEAGLSGDASELIREVPGSNLDRGIEFPDRGFPWFSSRKRQDNTSNQTTATYLYNISSIIH